MKSASKHHVRHTIGNLFLSGLTIFWFRQNDQSSCASIWKYSHLLTFIETILPNIDNIEHLYSVSVINLVSMYCVIPWILVTVYWDYLTIDWLVRSHCMPWKMTCHDIKAHRQSLHPTPKKPNPTVLPDVPKQSTEQVNMRQRWKYVELALVSLSAPLDNSQTSWGFTSLDEKKFKMRFKKALWRESNCSSLSSNLNEAISFSFRTGKS